MALIYKHRGTGRFTLRGAKHGGETLEQVADADLPYLEWILKKCSNDLDDESFYALEDILKAKGVEVGSGSSKQR